MNIHFQHTQYIWLFAAIAIFFALFYLRARWKQKVIKKIGDIRLIRLLIGGFSQRRFNLKFSLLSLAFIAGVFAVMNLQKPGAADGLSRKGIDVVIALDVSRSMMATDMPPNRLERAKELINRLMNAMPDDRFALIVFAGKAYLQMPLTNDHGAASMFVAAAGPDAVAEQGTVISEALRRTASVFNANERRFKSVILISDGEDHDAEAVKTATELAEQGMMISTVGIGSPEGSYITDPATGENKKDESGSQVISKLNEEELKEIASVTKGTYVRLDDSADAVAKLRGQLSQIESIALDDVSLVNFKTYYWMFAGLMLLLLIGEFFIPETKKSKERRLKEQMKNPPETTSIVS
ncbi:MAG: VWA domain-containing protein, partial [Chitinophagaceae bacterium]